MVKINPYPLEAGTMRYYRFGGMRFGFNLDRIVEMTFLEGGRGRIDLASGHSHVVSWLYGENDPDFANFLRLWDDWEAFTRSQTTQDPRR